MRPAKTTIVSTPRTSQPSASAATNAALPCACSRTSSTGSASNRSSSSNLGNATSNGIPNCSRMAQRCDDRDAKKISDANDASAKDLVRHPKLFGQPSLRPLSNDPLVVGVRRRALRYVQLDQTVKLKTIITQQIDQLAGQQMELHLTGVKPLNSMHTI